MTWCESEDDSLGSDMIDSTDELEEYNNKKDSHKIYRTNQSKNLNLSKKKVDRKRWFRRMFTLF